VRRGSEEASPPRKRDRTPDDQTPLCQECAKTGRRSPTIRGQSGHEPAAELGIPIGYGTV
jgi:hypothetical protein